MRKNEIRMSFVFCEIGGLEFEGMPKMQARRPPRAKLVTYLLLTYLLLIDMFIFDHPSFSLKSEQARDY